MSVKNIDFDQLKGILLERLGQPGMPTAATAANALSAMTEFLRERGIATTEIVGSTLRLSFYRERDEHLATLRARRSTAYINNRRSLLGYWRQLIRALDHEGATHDGTTTPLQQVLRTFMEERKLKPTAKLAGMSPATLARWLKGALPRPGMDHYLTRLEVIGELPPRHFTDLLPYNTWRRGAPAQDLSPVIEYRTRLAKQSKDPYQLKRHSALSQLRTEWRLLLAYKTSSSDTVRPISSTKISAVEMLRGALAVEEDLSEKQWRLVSCDRSAAFNDERDWVDVIAGQECATAGIDFAYAANFMGWAMLPVERGGRGLSPEAAQTLGLFCDQELIAAFLEWRVERSDGINSSVTSFLNFAAMLLHAESGFLTTQADIAARCRFEPAAWVERCETVHAWINAYKRKISRHVVLSRDPKDPIRASLDLPMPLDNFTLASRRLESCKPSTGGEDEAIWARDVLMLALLVSNPLRALNIRRMTYKPDNTGHLRQNTAGEWRIFIDKKEFKNVRGAAKHKHYDQAVDESVWPYIRRYLKDYRKTLGGSRPELIFVSSDQPNGLWGAGLNRRYAALTKRYVPGCPGVGPHAFRHLVCTSIILRTQDFTLAADTLHDMEATVRTKYTHLLASNGDRGRKSALGSTLAQMAPRPFVPPTHPKPTDGDRL